MAELKDTGKALLEPGRVWCPRGLVGLGSLLVSLEIEAKSWGSQQGFEVTLAAIRGSSGHRETS